MFSISVTSRLSIAFNESRRRPELRVPSWSSTITFNFPFSAPAVPEPKMIAKTVNMTQGKANVNSIAMRSRTNEIHCALIRAKIMAAYLLHP